MKRDFQNIRRWIACLCAILMTTAPLLSCGGGTEADTPSTQQNTTNTTDTAAETQETGPATDENGYLCDDLPQLDFGGETIHLLYWSDVENQEFESEELTGEIVNDAIFQRNTNVEDRLNVRYNWIGTPGNGGNIEPYVKKVRESHTAGDNSYDILASYSRSIASCLVNGFLTNLESAAYLDYEKPWWPDNLLEESTINGHLYFVSGDISTKEEYKKENTKRTHGGNRFRHASAFYSFFVSKIQLSVRITTVSCVTLAIPP